MRLAVFGEERAPVAAQPAPARANRLGEPLAHAVGNQELGVLRPAVGALGQPHLVSAERLAVGGGGVLLVRRAIADDALDHDQCRPVVRRLERLERAARASQSLASATCSVAHP